MSALPSGQLAALRALLALWKAERFIVIGAAAIELQLGLRWRRTADLDLSVASSPDVYAGDLESLGWRRRRTAPQRWIAPDGTFVDVVPGHPALVGQGGFTWPDGGAILSLVGFRLAFSDAVLVDAAPGVSVRVASVRSLIPLKIAAYLDRPWERESDLDDIVHILHGFLGADAGERWSDELIDLGLDFEDVSPFALGRQLRELVDEAERGLVRTFVARIEDPADRLSTLERMARAAPAAWKDPEELRLRVHAFRRGFEASPPTRAGVVGPRR